MVTDGATNSNAAQAAWAFPSAAGPANLPVIAAEAREHLRVPALTERGLGYQFGRRDHALAAALVEQYPEYRPVLSGDSDLSVRSFGPALWGSAGRRWFTGCVVVVWLVAAAGVMRS